MIYALIVVYNKECKDSETIKSIYNWKNEICINIFDNSTKPNNNKEFCNKEGFQYFSLGKNIGISRAYNYVINNIALDDNDYVMILDDDTELSEEYIKEVLSAVFLKKDIYLPVVHSGGVIISPTNIKHKCGSKIVNSIDELQFDNMSAINSGMVVKANVYKKFQYNEELFLDCVDHEFMQNVRKEKCTIHILDNGIVQNFSRDEKPSIENALFRFKLFKSDFKKYCEINDAKLYFIVSIMKFVLSYSIKYRTLRFAKVWLNNN